MPNTWLVEAVNPSTGEKKMIDIASYASVVAGNFTESKKWRLNSEGVANLDLNDTRNYSVVYFSGCLNGPSGIYQGMCMTFAYGTAYKLQYVVAGGQVVYIRAYVNGWSEWRRADNFGYNTLAELASGVAESLNVPKFFAKDRVTTGTVDCNTIKETCSILVEGTNLTNGPTAIRNYSELYVMAGRKSCIQFVLSEQGVAFQRFYKWSAAAWTDWKQI